ncbi:MAG TPA: PP2C family protein-serine/threonine phosphatase, partial [Pyrinomonadaceae bacterium]
RRTAVEVQTVASGEGSGGPAMGLIPNAQFKTCEAKLSPGDFLLFFTDGVIEVEDKRDREFGIQGLQQSIRSNVHQPTESLLEAIISDVYNFAGSKVLTDDACLVVGEL